MDIEGYLSEIRGLYATGQTTEHSFRPALLKLFKSVDPALVVINEPKHLTDVGAPDFVFNRSEIAIGWCEAKDLGRDIRKFAANDYSKAQKERYKKGLPNLIYTNGLDFEFIREGEVVDFISIADLRPKLPSRSENFSSLKARLRDFTAATPLSITSSKRLAEMMAGKSAIIKDIMGRALTADVAARDGGAASTDLVGQYDAFKSDLIHDITIAEFADIYAETLAYGLFAARLHDDTQDSFTRSEALELLPKSNPFLRQLFIYIAGPDLDERLRRIIDELCSLFAATNMAKVLANFGKVTGRQDPFLHFYEVFLAEYNPDKRKSRGVWYTPEAVVNFIVRAVDETLVKEFGVPDGLADTGRVTIDWDTGQNDKKGKPVTLKKQVHRIQLLDPATGTGTFLAEVVKLVASRVKGIAPGQWSNYVETDLIPRIHGFELLMASYAMCHTKLDMILTALGYKPSVKPPRLGVYLTNSLDEGERVEQTLFGLSRAIAEEAKAASDIKRQTPIMCVIGNPPYNIMSGNLSDEQKALIDPYRSVDGVRIKEKGMLQFEKNINNDYVKFLSMSEQIIRKNGFGVLGFVTSHSYLKSASFRGLRAHLLETFHRIYILDLHGNSEIREVTPEGIKDENIFDIKQGVSVIIAVRLRAALKGKGTAYFTEMWGDRQSKYDLLSTASVSSIEWTDCEAQAPDYTFYPPSAAYESYVKDYLSLSKMMPLYSSGVITARDGFSIDEDKSVLAVRAKAFAESKTQPDSEFCRELGIAEKKGWDVTKARKALSKVGDYEALIEDICYRPFDVRKIIFHESLVWTTARSTMQNMLRGPNVILISARSEKSGTCSHFFTSDKIVETKCGERTTQSAVFPLYIYPDANDLDQSVRINFDPKLYARIRKAAGLTGPLTSPDGTDAFRKASGDARPDEVKVFDYFYGVLHSPKYRASYAPFLKMDFPRIPYPSSPKTFTKISAQGEALRRLHLMESEAIGDTPYPFMGDGESVIGKIRYESKKVWINDTQYFSNVPMVAWSFYVGGYQPAQKWLKDRRGRELTWGEIRHYQKIIKVLTETHHLMRQIDSTGN